MTDRRPACVYGILVRDRRVFLRSFAGGALGLPGGVFRPLADDRKVELRAHLYDQLGIDARAIWAQGAFDYTDPASSGEAFSGFYTVWDWDGEPPTDAGCWLDAPALATAALPDSLRVLLLSVVDTLAVRTR